MKCSIFWVMTLCSLLKINLRFGRTYIYIYIWSSGSQSPCQIFSILFEPFLWTRGDETVTFFFLFLLQLLILPFSSWPPPFTPLILHILFPILIQLFITLHFLIPLLLLKILLPQYSWCSSLLLLIDPIRVFYPASSIFLFFFVHLSFFFPPLSIPHLPPVLRFLIPSFLPFPSISTSLFITSFTSFSPFSLFVF
jgi:hypothetical protein